MKKHLESARKYLNAVDTMPHDITITDFNELRRSVDAILTHLEQPNEDAVCPYCEAVDPAGHADHCPNA